MQAKRAGLVKNGHMVLMKVKLSHQASRGPILLLCWGGRGVGGGGILAPYFVCTFTHTFSKGIRSAGDGLAGTSQADFFSGFLSKVLCPRSTKTKCVCVGGGGGLKGGVWGTTQKDARGAIRETARADGRSEIFGKQIA